MQYELAIDENGDPFDAPAQVSGWRVRRALEGRGRPLLVHAKGRPLIVRANASYDELLSAAGPGRYRLEAVDAAGHKVEGVPIACTGPLHAEEEPSDEPAAEPFGGAHPRARSYEDVVCQLVAANTRMTERVIGQLGTVMSGVAELIAAAKDAGITTRPQPAPPIEIVEPEEAAPAAGILEQLTPLIQQAIPFIFEVLAKARANGATIAGMPIEAFVDCRAAAPTAQPAGPVEPAAAASMTSAPSTNRPSTVTGAAPGLPGAGAAPEPVASAPTNDEKAAAVNAHVLQIFSGLAPAERLRASQLVARLTVQERGAWLAELARLTVPEATARARAVLQTQATPAPRTAPTAPQLPSGDPVPHI